jgi:hypothetical protein
MHLYAICGYDTTDTCSISGARVNIFGIFTTLDSAVQVHYLKNAVKDSYFDVYRNEPFIYWICELSLGNFPHPINIRDGARCKVEN